MEKISNDFVAITTASDGMFAIEGDRTGATRRLVHIGDGRITTAVKWGDLVCKIGFANLRLRRSSAALLLRCGFVPAPYTLYEDVYQLSPGDTVTVNLKSGTVQHKNDFPFLNAYSRQSNTWNPDEFSRLLCEAVEKVVQNDPVCLLLSAGKDSMALLWALRAIGKRDVTCVTYDAGHREQEAAVAAEMAQKFGFRHIVVEADPAAEFADLLDFLKSCPHPTFDFAMPAALAAVKEARNHGSVILDGCGNDRYMYYSPNKRERILRALSIPSRFGLAWAANCPQFLRGRLAYIWSSVFMHRVERWFPGSRLSANLIQHIVGETDDVRAFVRNLDLALATVQQNESATIAKARFSDFSGGMEKTRLATEHFGINVAFPFSDKDLINYYFHLPANERFNSMNLEAKLSFKRWLRKQNLDSPYFHVKGSFRYNMSSLFENNKISIMSLIDESENIKVTNYIKEIFSGAEIDYFKAQEAYLIFGLVYWASQHKFVLNKTL